MALRCCCLATSVFRPGHSEHLVRRRNPSGQECLSSDSKIHGGPILGSFSEGSYLLGSILGAPAFWKLPDLAWQAAKAAGRVRLLESDGHWTRQKLAAARLTAPPQDAAGLSGAQFLRPVRKTGHCANRSTFVHMSTLTQPLPRALALTQAHKPV